MIYKDRRKNSNGSCQKGPNLFLNNRSAIPPAAEFQQPASFPFGCPQVRITVIDYGIVSLGSSTFLHSS